MCEVIVALDAPSAPDALAIVDRLGGSADFYKVGLELFTAEGPAVVRELIARHKRVFLDLKLHDIPNTVAGAVRSAAGLGVDYLTLHAGGGAAMIAAAAEAAEGKVALLAVTVLTHLDDVALAELGLPGDSGSRARDWAALAARAGAAGVVCSPLEVASLRARHPPPFRLVTPGIRPAGAAADDQRRTASPRAARAAGADLLVIGRPLTQATDRDAALAALAAELA